MSEEIFRQFAVQILCLPTSSNNRNELLALLKDCIDRADKLGSRISFAIGLESSVYSCDDVYISFTVSVRKGNGLGSDSNYKMFNINTPWYAGDFADELFNQVTV